MSTVRQRKQLLTRREHALIEKLGECAGEFNAIIGTSCTRTPDLEEVFAGIHHLQQAVMSQAAARAYPIRYRLLGGLVKDRKRAVSK